MDLNLLITDDGKLDEKKVIIDKIQTAFKLGYNVVALNVRIDGSQLQKFDCKSKKKEVNNNSVIPEPPEITFSDIESSYLTLCGRNPKILTRLTVVVSDSLETNIVTRSQVVRKYDLLAYEVTTSNLFKDACTRLEFDILSIDLAQKVTFQIRRPLLQLSARRGIFIEFQYSPAIKDKMARRNIIHSTNYILRSTNKRNIIMTSGADKVAYLRGAYDVANLGMLFGMNQNCAKESLNQNCQSVILHAASRRMTKGAIEVTPIDKLTEEESWIAKQAEFVSIEEVSSDEFSDSSNDNEKHLYNCDEPIPKKIKLK